MNRRNFFKTVTGFIAGIFAVPKSKAEDKLMCGGQNSTLCPRCKFNCKGCSIGIDPNSEWAKQKPLSLDDLRRVKEEIDAAEWRRQVWNYPAYVIHEDGSIEKIPYQDFYKQT